MHFTKVPVNLQKSDTLYLQFASIKLLFTQYILFYSAFSTIVRLYSGISVTKTFFMLCIIYNVCHTLARIFIVTLFGDDEKVLYDTICMYTCLIVFWCCR